MPWTERERCAIARDGEQGWSPGEEKKDPECCRRLRRVWLRSKRPAGYFIMAYSGATLCMGYPSVSYSSAANIGKNLHEPAKGREECETPRC